MRAKFIVEKDTPTSLTISDIGSDTVSVTNDAEAVVLYLHGQGMGVRRLFYYDSEGHLDELVHDGNGKFLSFGPGLKCSTCICEPCICGLTTW